MRLEIISKHPVESRHPTSLLFIHGMMHGAWRWDAHFLDYFFSADLPDEELRAYWKLMQDESYMALLDMVALDLPRPVKVKTPLLVLGAARDNMLSPGEIEATARAYHTQPEIIPDVAHNSMLESRWQTVAERILVWLKERKL